MQILEAQTTNAEKYKDTIAARGALGNWLRLTEEVGELAKAIRRGNPLEIQEEAADVLAWLLTNCSVQGVDLQSAYVEKYGSATCFRCGNERCNCKEKGLELPKRG